MLKWPPLMLLGLVAFVGTAEAVPNQMNVQGRLLNGGNPMTGAHAAIFRIYDAAILGNVLWTESSSLDVQGGIFSATIGSVTPLPALIFDNQPRWLDVTIDGSVLSPRLSLASNGYAFKAQRADTANFALNAASAGDNVWSTDGTNAWRGTGKVGIGTATPDQDLGINGMVGIYPRTWVQPAARGMFMWHGPSPGDGGSLYAYDYTAGHGEPIGMGGSQVTLDTYNSSGLYDGPKLSVQGDGKINVTNSLGIGPSTPWGDHGLYLDAATYNTLLSWDNRVNCGFYMYQAQGSNIFYLASTGGGSGETWRFVSAGLGDLFRVGSTITSYRDMTINGSLTVTGTKCRAVQTDYGQLKMNADESAHALFMDDQPSARLVDGQCRVNLSPKFLSTITVNGKYPLSVSVTFYGRHGGEWYVRRDMTGFTVIDPSGSNAEFSWQAIGRQKGYEETDLEPMTQAAAESGGAR